MELFLIGVFVGIYIASMTQSFRLALYDVRKQTSRPRRRNRSNI
jgi:hypothetical protein